jgi:orotidine-5'-phosphate decarboxylase
VPPSFPDRLTRLVEERRSQIVLGLDPDPAALWPAALDPAAPEPAAPGPAALERAALDLRPPESAAPDAASAEPGAAAGAGGPATAPFAPDPSVAERTAAAVARHCRAAIDAAGPACVAVKLQAACFERLGAPGWSALAGALGHARSRGLLAIVDGKRGDVPVTARAYAQALVGETPGPYGAVPGLGADAFTANPLLGRDSLEPLVGAATAAGAGVFCLVRTSNPGAAELQDEPAERPLHESLARMVDELGATAVGDCGLSAVGAVAGATRPELLGRLRELMPRAILLLPGVGAQGGDVASLAAAFEPHPAAGLVTASRSIVDAHAGRGGDAAAAAAAAAEELRAAAWSLAAG